MLIGYAIAFIGYIWLLVVIFQNSILWGLGSIVIPLVGLIFVAMNWEDTKKPFLTQLGGVGIAIVGAVMEGGTGIA